MIAATARAHQVLPAVLTAAVARYNVVEREIVGLDPAVLTRVVVAHEDLFTRKLGHRMGSLDQVQETNDRWAPVRRTRRPQLMAVELDDLGLSANDEHKGAVRV